MCDKNLCGHSKFRYDECYAKVILEGVYPDEYKDLILSDKPDLRDSHNIQGIEVVNCVPKEKQETTKMWVRANKTDGKTKARCTERMEQLGIEYTGGVQFWGSEVYTSDLDKSPIMQFIAAVGNKLKKLNDGGYEDLQRYELFVLSEIFIPDYQERKVLDRLVALNGIYAKVYRLVYLVTNDNEVVKFDLKDNVLSKRNFDDYQRTFALKAKRIMNGETK